MNLQIEPSLHECASAQWAGESAPARVGMADVQSVESMSGREDAGAQAGEMRMSATSVPTESKGN